MDAPTARWEIVAGLRPAGLIVEEVAAGLRLEAGDARVVSRERLVTEEGEYAARAVLDVGSGRARVAVGIVFGDDQHAVAVDDAQALSARQVAAVRLGLPQRRRRRFSYAAPTGWRSLPGTGLGTIWHRGESMIVVYAALPVRDGLAAGGTSTFLVDETTFPVTSHQASPIRNARGLSGISTDLDGTDGLVAQVVVFEDAQCLYPLRLETTTLEYLPAWRAFIGLIDSIEPLPFRATGQGAMAHWED